MEVKVYDNESFHNSGQDLKLEQDSETATSEEASEAASSKESYDFDVIMKEVGDLKIYQLFLVLLVTWITIPDG